MGTFWCYTARHMNAIDIQDLKKVYHTKGKSVEALKGVTFSIKEGEFFGLLGPNGAGKSTTINILSGVSEKSGGDISVLGQSISKDITEVKKLIGVVPQEISFDVFFSVEVALKFRFGYYDLPVDQGYLNMLLKRLSLEDKRDVKPRMLSGGMKRRLMIAQALVHRPRVLILDEPTAGVDVELRHDLYDFVRELNRQGTTVVLTSHYLEEVELLCERVAIINKGTLVALDDKKTLKNRFKTTRDFVIALSEPLKEVPEILKPFSPTVNEAELRLSFEENEYQNILKAVAKADLPVANFQIIEPTLEQTFIDLTKK